MAVVALPFAGWNWWTHRELAAAQSRIVAAGLPRTLVELQPPKVSAGENAEPEITRIRALTEAPPWNAGAGEAGLGARLAAFEKDHRARKLDPESLVELAELLAAPVAVEIHALAHAAARKGKYDAQLDLTQGVALVLPNVAALRATGNLLRGHARLRASRGEFEAAQADVAAIFTLAEFSAAEPTLISQLVRYVCLGISIEALEHLAAIGALDARAAGQFAARLDALSFRVDFLRALDGERIGIGEGTFAAFIAGNREGIGGMVSTEATRWLRWMPAGLFRLEYAEYLDRMRQIRVTLAQPATSAKEQLGQLEAITSAVDRKHILVNVVLPALQSLSGTLWEFETRIAIARVGVALHRHQLQHGQPPDALAELVPAFLPSVPLDLMTGQPLHYTRSGERSVVYSVGKNLQDDGGRFAPQEGADDRLWTSEPPAR